VRPHLMHLHFHRISLYSRINCDCTAWLIFLVNVLLFSIHFDLPHPFGDRPVLLTHRVKLRRRVCGHDMIAIL